MTAAIKISTRSATPTKRSQTVARSAPGPSHPEDLRGAWLDWACAQCCGLPVYVDVDACGRPRIIQSDSGAPYEPTKNWLQAAYVIEVAEAQLMMKFSQHRDDHGRWAATAWVDSRRAHTLFSGEDEQTWCAALRLAVWRFMGESIRVPI